MLLLTAKACAPDGDKFVQPELWITSGAATTSAYTRSGARSGPLKSLAEGSVRGQADPHRRREAVEERSGAVARVSAGALTLTGGSITHNTLTATGGVAAQGGGLSTTAPVDPQGHPNQPQPTRRLSAPPAETPHGIPRPHPCHSDPTRTPQTRIDAVSTYLR